MKCQNCGIPLKEGTLICPNCAVEVRMEKQQTPPPKKKELVRFKKKGILAACAAGLVLILAAGIAIGVASGKPDGETGPVLYEKEKGLFIQNIDQPDPFQVTDSLAAAADGAACVLSGERGEMLVFGDSPQADGSYKLYYRDTQHASSQLKDSDEKRGVLLSTNVTGTPQADQRFKKIAYLKGGDKLRIHNLKEEITVDGDVSSFVLSGDGKQIVYGKRNSSGTLDLYRTNTKGSGNPVLLASDVAAYYAVDPWSLNEVAYTKQESGEARGFSLYEQGKKGDARRLAEGASEVFVQASPDKQSNLLYFTQELTTQKQWSELLTDDLAESDMQLTEPKRADYQDREAFDAAIDRYDGKIKRDAARQQAQEKTVSIMNRTLSRFDQKNGVKELASFLDEIWTTTPAGVIYVGHAAQTLQPVKLSELGQYDYNLDTATEKMTAVQGLALYLRSIDGQAVTLLEDYAESAFVACGKDAKLLYVAENYDKAQDSCDLYQYDLTKLPEVEKKKIDVSVRKDSILMTEDGGVYYRKNVSADNIGTLYAWRGKKPVKIADGVSIVSQAGIGSVFYLTGYSPAGDRGSLYLCQKTKTTKIDDSVKNGAYTYRDGGNVLYLRSYDTNAGYGQVFWYKGRENKALVGERVSRIF